VRKAKDKFSSHRYVAVNITDETVELRVFRGTLRYSSFRACMEYAHAAYVFTRDAAVTKINRTRFEEFVLENAKEYPNLLKRLRLHTRLDPNEHMAAQVGEL